MWAAEGWTSRTDHAFSSHFQSFAHEYSLACDLHYNAPEVATCPLAQSNAVEPMRYGRTLCILSVMDANELQIAVTQGDNATILSVSGRVSVDSSPMLRNRLLAVLRSETRPAVVVDLTKSPSVDCSGIATLVEALKIARNNNVALRLTGLQGRLKSLFEVTGVLSLFEASSHTTGSSTSKVL